MPVEIKCDFCGKSITKPPSEVERAEHHFCDRECTGTDAAKEKTADLTSNVSTAGPNTDGMNHHSRRNEHIPSVARNVWANGR